MCKPMKLLIVEGNMEETIQERESFGITPYHRIFLELLNYIEPSSIVDVVFPADADKKLLPSNELQKYDGVLWTGSALSVLDDTPSVTQQFNFAEDVFKSGVPFYGSCWALQLAVVVSGGKVGPSKNGLEFGITEKIKITEEGKRSPYFANRKNNYRSLSIHFDEIIKLPDNAVVLAGNDHSRVQAITINYKNSQFFGVQYHPEFRTGDMALITSFLSKQLVANGLFPSTNEVDAFLRKLSDQTELPNEIVDYVLHTQEIRSWLNFIKRK
jgi:GMP synthase (glutamine-hydrolysing)